MQSMRNDEIEQVLDETFGHNEPDPYRQRAIEIIERATGLKNLDQAMGQPPMCGQSQHNRRSA